MKTNTDTARAAIPTPDLDSRMMEFERRLTTFHFAMASIASAYDCHGAPSEEVMWGLSDLLGDMAADFKGMYREWCDQSWRDLAKSNDPEDRKLVRIIRRNDPKRFKMMTAGGSK